MTTPTPDVRRATVDALNMFVDRKYAEAWADHLLSVLTPVVRQQERAAIAEELRTTIADQASWLWFDLGESALLRVARFIEESPAAVARSHVHPRTEQP
ncbi:MAG TPA: hypothetical protein VFG87_23405 [Amycolatopsis sp.]|jgi:hypothetical protein|nr:hypothetical protein [Amycolatopsis sp.]